MGNMENALGGLGKEWGWGASLQVSSGKPKKDGVGGPWVITLPVIIRGIDNDNANMATTHRRIAGCGHCMALGGKKTTWKAHAPPDWLRVRVRVRVTELVEPVLVL